MIANQLRRVVCCVSLAAALVSPTFPTFAATTPPASFADIVEPLMPAVVNISTTQKVKNGKGNIQMFGSPQSPEMQKQMQDLFSRMFPPGSPNPFMMPEGEIERHSLGSGFIVDSQGYVVTNNHVIDDASEIHVILSDNTKLDATVVGRDEKTDLALIKVKTKKSLPFVKFGDSEKTRVGDWVVAIGNPFGLGGSVTAGILSARARNINGSAFDDFLQTDASINRGNSGGPLFNTNGEVIGINTAIFSPSGGSIGIGFAIPSSLAKSVVEELKEHGAINRGWLGVRIQIVTSEIAESIGLKEPVGALVSEVTPDSPADKAGLKAGDVITRFDGKEIKEMRFLARFVASTTANKKVAIEYLRNGNSYGTTVTIGKMQEAEKQQSEKESKSGIQSGKKLSLVGLQLAPLDGALRQQLGLDEKIKGLVITDIDRNSFAAQVGLGMGDILVSINNTAVPDLPTAQKVINAARSKDRQNVLLQVLHEGGVAFITLPLDEEKN